LKLITALIIVTVKKQIREVMVATELTRRMETKPRPGPSHLNLHQALTLSGTPCVHKGFLIPSKRDSLDNSNATALSYKTIVEGNDVEDTMSEHKKDGIRMKARYLAQAYRIAIEEMPFKTWNDCCREAIKRFAAVIDFESRKRLCCVAKQGRWECRSIERRNFTANLQVKGSSMLGGVRRISTAVNP
jgi:hypothetical protein